MTVAITAFERSPDEGKVRRSSNSQPPGCWGGDKSWNKERMPLVEDRVRNRLKQLSARLGDADWLDGVQRGR